MGVSRSRSLLAPERHPYVDKDVEKDPAAAREMQQKLAKSGLHEGSIPVIDVRGKVMIGFNPAENRRGAR